jgi:cytoskeletal protein RodZ
MTIGWVLLFAAVAIAAVLALLGALWLIRALINSRGADPPA